jgi:hypothetical protein
MGGEVFTIQVRALPSDVPPHQRLKRLLKLLLRGFEFRCTRIEEPTPRVGQSPKESSS